MLQTILKCMETYYRLGFTIPEVDKILLPYAIKSYNKYFKDEVKKLETLYGIENIPFRDRTISLLKEMVLEKIQREIEQGFQSWEYKFNTLASSRGDYPFVAISLGLEEHPLAQMIIKGALDVRAKGQGEEGKKRPVLFPKIIFLYDENKHGIDKPLNYLYLEGIKCSSKALYPDFLSLTGDGYVADIYKEYGEVISPMGCRAYLSPYWRKGGQQKKDETDTPIYTGRANAGAISLNLPMIFMKAKEENKDFYEVLDYYLEMIRGLHIKTKEHLSNMKASINPLAFTQGGLLFGDLNPDDNIAPIVDHMTFSYGITALAELQRLYNRKSLVEDGDFAYNVLVYINEYIDKIKTIDNILYAIYSTPAESLCHTQVKQFRNKYGVIKNVSDRDYFTNSFHMPVWEDITGSQKQDLEYRFFHKSNGGHIQYCRYPNGQNLQAIKALVDRAMRMGFYEGINIEKNYCDDCGHEFEDGHKTCPKCESTNITQINRVCGYIGYSKINGTTRMNEGKMQEIKDRVSM